MGTQLIRLTQIKANLQGFMDFEQQLIAMFGDNNAEKFVALEGQKTFTLSKTYAIGKNMLRVFVNGILQSIGDGYIELNTRMISFTEPLFKDDVVVVVRNQFRGLAGDMGHERVKAYNIYRTSYYITEVNQNTLTWAAPNKYQLNLNQLKVYSNGILLIPGTSFDYVELNENEFKLTHTFPVGTVITAEVINGGLNVYQCYRQAFFIDSNSVTQRTFKPTESYNPGTNNLKVYLNGLLLRPGLTNDYVENDSLTFTLNYDLPAGAILEAEITKFTVDVFTIIRRETIVTAANINNVDFTTSLSYNLGESNLRVYLNGILLREGADNDYVEVDETHFRVNSGVLLEDSIIEYEIINW